MNVEACFLGCDNMTIYRCHSRSDICHQRCSATLTKSHWPLAHISNLLCLTSFSGWLYRSEYDLLCSHSVTCEVRLIRVNISTFNLAFMRLKSNLATSNICHWVRLKLGKMNVEREFNSNFVNVASALALFLWSAFRFWWAFHLIWDFVCTSLFGYLVDIQEKIIK